MESGKGYGSNGCSRQVYKEKLTLPTKEKNTNKSYTTRGLPSIAGVAIGMDIMPTTPNFLLLVSYE